MSRVGVRTERTLEPAASCAIERVIAPAAAGARTAATVDSRTARRVGGMNGNITPRAEYNCSSFRFDFKGDRRHEHIKANARVPGDRGNHPGFDGSRNRGPGSDHADQLARHDGPSDRSGDARD